MEYIISKKDLDNLKNFQKFIQSEKGLSESFNKMLKEKIRKDLWSQRINNKEFETLQSIMSSGLTNPNWLVRLISSIVNASNSIETMNGMIRGERFEPEDIDVDRYSHQINVKSVMKTQPELSEAEFMNQISFHSNGKDGAMALQLLDIMQTGGEFLTRKEDSQGEGEDEVTTYTINAHRGYHLTNYLESMIQESLMSYFASNVSDIDEELSKKFDNWAKENGFEVDKGK